MSVSKGGLLEIVWSIMVELMVSLVFSGVIRSRLLLSTTVIIGALVFSGPVTSWVMFSTTVPIGAVLLVRVMDRWLLANSRDPVDKSKSDSWVIAVVVSVSNRGGAF